LTKHKRVAVGFYKDADGKTRPVTKPLGELKRKKIIKKPSKFKGVSPQGRPRFGVQLAIGKTRLEEVQAIKNPKFDNKPRDGFWTSTYLPRGKFASDWAYFLLYNDKRELRKQQGKTHLLLKVKPSARVYHIDSYGDLAKLVRRYPHKVMMEEFEIWRKIGLLTEDGAGVRAPIDWEKVAQDYDGVHLTDDGQGATRHSYPYDLYGWDAESTVWFRNVFSRLEPYRGKLLR